MTGATTPPAARGVPAEGSDAVTTTVLSTAYGTPVSPRRAPLPDITPNNGLYRAAKVVFRWLFRLILDVRVVHADRVPSRGPVLIAGNHRSFLDAPLVAAFIPRPAGFLAKSELFRGPAIRPLMWFGQIPIDRGRPDREALRRAVTVLDRGGVLGMFPEGTRGVGDVRAVQHGVGYVALRVPGVTIVPVACIGTDRAMPMGSRFPRWGSRVHVVFGTPFTVSVPQNPRTRAAVATAAEEIRVALAAHVAHAEAEVRRAAHDAARGRGGSA